ncbi:MAG: hypothetical protein KA712_12075 [Myxococcales bacterium]|nr:hypothetical protein [Myxococcales bacterium]
MAAVASPLGKLHDELLAFANQPEQKLLVIETEEDLRKDVLEQVEALDLLVQAPVVVSIFESPWMANDAFWDARHDELEDEWEALQGAFAREKLPALPPLPQAPRKDIVGFASRLQAALAALAPHFEGMVVVLAPLEVETPTQLTQELMALMGQASLKAIRWMVVSLGPSGLKPLVEAQPKQAALAQITNDAAAENAQMKAAVAAMAAAPVGAHPAQLAGGVGPSVPPPRRKNAVAAVNPPAPDLAASLPAGAGDAAAMHKLRLAVMGAALAAGDGDYPQALQKQREARETTAALDMGPETAALDLILGSYGLMAKQPKLALDVFVDVETRAKAAGWGAVAVQSAMARAGALMQLERRPEAAAAYVEGGRSGAKLGAPALGIESFGLGGQLLADLGDHRRALASWSEALLTAEQAKPEDVTGSSVLEIGDKGVALARRIGSAGEAGSFAQRTQALRQAFEAAAAEAQPAEGQTA